MKIRQGFISNSSSSSFIINDKDITKHQFRLLQTIEEGSGWEIHTTHGSIVGYTDMANFDMEAFTKKIGIPKEAVRWSVDDSTDFLDGDWASDGDFEDLIRNWEKEEAARKEEVIKILHEMEKEDKYGKIYHDLVYTEEEE